jgi:hypothetical protein
VKKEFEGEAPTFQNENSSLSRSLYRSAISRVKTCVIHIPFRKLPNVLLWLFNFKFWLLQKFEIYRDICFGYNLNAMVFKFSFYEMNFILLVAILSYLLNSSDKT